ncbi:MAG: valine--tRNA ligase [Alphaproteobacteria bacterium]|nr:valine--tRNA ligase [Alphaproteobacteria bacterium]
MTSATTSGAPRPGGALDKTYDPATAEARWAARWEEGGAFACGQSQGAPYTIVIPPPNVTGSLHMGHALNNTLQDILVRWRRMKGDDVLWQPGTDHAGIATQMVVERQLAAKGIALARPGTVAGGNVTTIGRDDFLSKVWEWKAESGGTITRQLRRLGASVDWSRERFTMDPGLSAAVLKVFVELYRKGLIYRDARLVNWDPKLHTAISDLEVEQREIKGSLWHIRYPIVGDPDRFIVVATTRPETMLGDTGVAVHPDDERFRDLVGREALLPLVGRRIRIVADSYSDPEKGTGAVKITPAHDFNDFEVGKRHDLAAINVLTADARISDAAPEAYRGLDRFEARKRIVADLEAQGFLVKVEPHTHMVPHGDRGGVPIEPWLTTQWYVDAKTLAEPAIAAVESGKTVFVPQSWEKTYFHWMRNIEPWCVSRQLWWGHQVPAWYGPDGQVFVDYDEAAAAAQARSHYGRDVALTRDPDVLDTWFSSALWPFSTLGWPEPTPQLARYYPTNVLVTGLDIIFFWVARMMMMGLHFMKEVPFHTVYIHALVRDEKGQKMSKSKGNVIDPLALIDKFGADALRFTLTAMAAQGRDVKLSESRVEGYRNFATKLWNAARYAEMNACRPPAAFDPNWAKLTVNRWVLGELALTVRAIEAALEGFRFNDAAGAAYQFVWGSFCDWYLEFTKPVLTGEDGPAKAETQAVGGYVLREILKLLHPMMPFITEELWDKLGFGDGRMLVVTAWPEAAALPTDAAAKDEMDWIVRAISELRTLRAEMNVPVAARLKLGVREASPGAIDRIRRHEASLRSLARVESIDIDPPSAGGGVAQLALPDATLVVPLAGLIDPAAERSRLGKEIARQEGEIGKIDRKLGNPDFLAKADPVVVEEQRDRRAEAAAAKQRLEAALSRLSGM